MAKFDSHTQIDVLLPGHQYPIIIGRNSLQDRGFLRGLVTSRQVLIITNETIAPLYLHYLQTAFAEIQCDVVILPDGELYKNQESLFKIYNSLIHNKHHRDTIIIALGGGVIGDLAGFAASTYQRGVGLIQIPTTLLAQVDASVGGKTAINHDFSKNIIGSFYQPKIVLMDLNTLNSLPEREFKAGIAEIIKYGLLAGGQFIDQIEKALKKGLTAQSAELPQLIEVSCRIKAQYVEDDEKELGQRALLNLGHTFAHALESYTNYQRWLHGEAVAIGLYCVALLSQNLGLIDSALVSRIEQMLTLAGLPHKIPASIDLMKLRKLMGLDKKIKNNCLRFVVIKELGDCYLNDQITEECLQKTLTGAVEGE